MPTMLVVLDSPSERLRETYCATQQQIQRERESVGGVTSLKHPRTMGSGSEPARGDRRCRGASPPPPACGEEEEEGPAAADVLAMAMVQALCASRRGGFGAIGRNREWEERGAAHLGWVVAQPSHCLRLQPHPLAAGTAAGAWPRHGLPHANREEELGDGGFRSGRERERRVWVAWIR